MNISTMNVSLKAINSQITVTRNRSITAPRWYAIMPDSVRIKLGDDFGKVFEAMESFGLQYVGADYNEVGQYLVEFEPSA